MRACLVMRANLMFDVCRLLFAVVTWQAGDILGCALDVDNRVMSFYLNGLGTTT